VAALGNSAARQRQQRQPPPIRRPKSTIATAQWKTGRAPQTSASLPPLRPPFPQAEIDSQIRGFPLWPAASYPPTRLTHPAASYALRRRTTTRLFSLVRWPTPFWPGPATVGGGAGDVALVTSPHSFTDPPPRGGGACQWWPELRSQLVVGRKLFFFQPKMAA
jgi:hypothetical protein